MNSQQEERARQKALDQLKAVDAAPDPLYDDIVQIAATVCEAPIALVSLIDRDRQWFKAKSGLALTQTPRPIAVCDHAIREPGAVFEVADLAQDERFSSFPYVLDGTARFYAGMPMTTADGAAIGTVCVLDPEPRQLTEQQRETMQALSRITMALLEADGRRHHAKVVEILESHSEPAAAIDRDAFRVVLVRVDRFTDVLESRGERATEKLVEALMNALQACLRADQDDSIDRISGTPEIVIILRGIDADSRLDSLGDVVARFRADADIGLLIGSAAAVRSDDTLISVYVRADEALLGAAP